MEEITAALYEKLTRTLIEKGLTVSVMESCTSGCIASLLTDTEGASAVMRGGFVTYCNEAKIRCGVPAETIEKYGVYSEETAAAMAEAVKKFYKTDIAIGVTGSLGRTDPANEDSVPGQVYLAIAFGDDLYRYSLDGISGRSRHESKLLIAEHVGRALLDGISKSIPG
ncbi:MAG: nicotinamide-nucleotide amidohydrolase family protein [Lachnospiraceae bacterium]|nr:nicotinamide-nucleotide amidohydrolase family protein [Lachnospiraceae bacterium]